MPCAFTRGIDMHVTEKGDAMITTVVAAIVAVIVGIVLGFVIAKYVANAAAKK